jgi:hypothetical protein
MVLLLVLLGCVAEEPEPVPVADPYADLLKSAPPQLAHTAAIAYGRWLRDQEPPDTTRWGYPVE